MKEKTEQTKTLTKTNVFSQSRWALFRGQEQGPKDRETLRWPWGKARALREKLWEPAEGKEKIQIRKHN